MQRFLKSLSLTLFKEKKKVYSYACLGISSLIAAELFNLNLKYFFKGKPAYPAFLVYNFYCNYMRFSCNCLRNLGPSPRKVYKVA